MFMLRPVWRPEMERFMCTGEACNVAAFLNLGGEEFKDEVVDCQGSGQKVDQIHHLIHTLPEAQNSMAIFMTIKSTSFALPVYPMSNGPLSQQ